MTRATENGTVVLRRRQTPAGLPVEVLESKLFQPTVRPGVVPRPELLARLRPAQPVPTVAVVAPAGYGKSTLLALWARADPRPFAWSSLDPDDNDPIVLLTHLAVAVDRVSPLPAAVFDALRSPGVSVPATVVPRLGAALSRLPRSLVLVVDDVHHLRDGPSLDALVMLVGHVRGRSQIALAGRGMPVPLGRQRAQGGTVEIGVHDLAFTPAEARSLLRAAGADLPDAEVGALARRTEGWAAGLYLAALARGAELPDDDRLVGEYLQAELLSRLPPVDLDFLTRTAVLDRLSGPLCDAVLETQGSAAVLDRLRRDNLFLVPLDGQGRWSRYHPLFRDLLHARLDAAGAGSTRELLRRAADWCESDGQLEAALRYARAGDDADRVARIAVTLAQPMYAAGRAATVLDWIDWVDARGATERHPAVAALGAYLCALTGRPASAERWADRAERWSGGPAGADDGVLTMWLTTVRGMMCRRGVDQMQRDVDDGGLQVPGAGSAADREYPMRLFLSGVVHLLLGDTDTAETRFEDATELIDEALRPPLFGTVLAYRALCSLERGNWGDAEPLIERAVSVARRAHAEGHITSAIVFALAARAALHRGDPTLARAHLVEAQRLRPLLSYAGPWYAVGTLLEMAEVSIGLGDRNGARLFLRDADAVLRRRADLGGLGKRTDEVRGRVGALEAGSGETTLTTAELRILPLLLTHLTLADIADRLFLSRHTVKSQVASMFGKLGVHTRRDAVARARELRLLES